MNEVSGGYNLTKTDVSEVLHMLRSVDSTAVRLDPKVRAFLALFMDVRLMEQLAAEAGVLWWLYTEEGPDAPSLIAGRRGDRGLVVWQAGDGQILSPVPDHGEPPYGHVDYRTMGGAGFPQPRASEVPVELMLKAVEELAQTHERPTCVTWAWLPALPSWRLRRFT